jgi:hypothetical protein
LARLLEVVEKTYLARNGDEEELMVYGAARLPRRAWPYGWPGPISSLIRKSCLVDFLARL